jgi:hypothetical protein
MKKAPPMEKREKLQQVMMKTLHEETDILNPDLQSILIDDLVTAFYNRLEVMKRIQHKQ